MVLSVTLRNPGMICLRPLVSLGMCWASPPTSNIFSQLAGFGKTAALNRVHTWYLKRHFGRSGRRYLTRSPGVVEVKGGTQGERSHVRIKDSQPEARRNRGYALGLVPHIHRRTPSRRGPIPSVCEGIEVTADLVPALWLHTWCLFSGCGYSTRGS